MLRIFEHPSREVYRWNDRANPPPEVVQLLEFFNIEPTSLGNWYAVPSFSNNNQPVGQAELLGTGSVDAMNTIDLLLGEPVLVQSLRIMDMLNGCLHQCNQCFVDAANPTKIFSVESLEKLFFDHRFIKLLQPDSLRLGMGGDLLNHPDAIRIVLLILEATKPLFIDRSHLSKHDQYKIKILINFRKNKEQELDKLIEIVTAHPNRFRLCISVPLNRTDTVSRQFQEYVLIRPEIFGEDFIYDNLGLINFRHSPILIPDIFIEDVRHHTYPSLAGRSMPPIDIQTINPEASYLRADHFKHHQNRGLVKIYLNPDGLWLHVYATMAESHTARVFIPLTPDNIGVLSHLSYHPDFPTPPNWPGGKSHLRSLTETNALQLLATERGINQLTGRII